ATRTMLIFSRAPLFLLAEAIATACFTQNRSIIHRRFNKTPYELINGRKLDISFLHVFGALCYRKNDREDIRKLGAKGDIGFFIRYFADSCAYRIYNRRTKTIMETMNVSFDELSAMAFEQRSSKPRLQFQWTKDHPLEQVIGEPSRPVLTRNQLRSDDDMCIFALTSKYVLEILKKYGMESCDPVGTPMEIKDKLDLDHNGTLVDATKYRSMIGALMYLTSSRPDIVHATCLCARYQAKPNEKHLKEVKRIFHYLRGTVNTGLWYTKDSSFELTGFSDADYAGCKDSFKSTSGGAQFLGEKLSKYVLEILKKYGMESCDPVGTPMEIKDKLDLDQNGTPVDATKYRSMIVALMYLTSSRPDIDSGFKLTGFSDADYAGCKDTFKSTSGGAQFLGEKLVSWSSKKQDCTALSTAEAEYVSLSA
nr:uncharacterized mitochondrial protein AtMg00810-like [Tanacetum cinerariifolium]